MIGSISHANHNNGLINAATNGVTGLIGNIFKSKQKI